MRNPRGMHWCGVVGAAGFVLVFLLNDAVKPDYEPVRDFVSEAAIGPGGWVQITNFVAAGVLSTVSSVAVSRTVNRWTGGLIGTYGVALAAAGVFVSDPVPSEHTTWHGLVHNLVSLIVFAALSVACFTASRWRPTPAWRWYCYASGVAVPALFVITGAVSDTTGLWQRLCIAVGWTWLVALNLRAMRLLPGAPR